MIGWWPWCPTRGDLSKNGLYYIIHHLSYSSMCFKVSHYVILMGDDSLLALLKNQNHTVLLIYFFLLTCSDHISDAKPPGQLLLLSTLKGAPTNRQHKDHPTERITLAINPRCPITFCPTLSIPSASQVRPTWVVAMPFPWAVQHLHQMMIKRNLHKRRSKCWTSRDHWYLGWLWHISFISRSLCSTKWHHWTVKWSLWSSWGWCLGPCSRGGVRHRTRYILLRPANAGTPLPWAGGAGWVRTTQACMKLQ